MVVRSSTEVATLVVWSSTEVATLDVRSFTEVATLVVWSSTEVATLDVRSFTEVADLVVWPSTADDRVRLFVLHRFIAVGQISTPTDDVVITSSHTRTEASSCHAQSMCVLTPDLRSINQNAVHSLGLTEQRRC